MSTKKYIPVEKKHITHKSCNLFVIHEKPEYHCDDISVCSKEKYYIRLPIKVINGFETLTLAHVITTNFPAVILVIFYVFSRTY